MIYANKLNDPISAIYHFKRFLELSPNTDKKDQVQAIIDKQGAIYAASLPNSGPGPDDIAKMQADNAALKKEVDDANNTIAQLQAKLTKSEAAAAAAAAAPAPAPSPSPTPPWPRMPPRRPPACPRPRRRPRTRLPPGLCARCPLTRPRAADGSASADTGSTNAAPISTAGARSYTVVKGDSYWRIAKKMYPGDTKNGVAKIQEANKQTMGKPLKIGQVLVIP